MRYRGLDKPGIPGFASGLGFMRFSGAASGDSVIVARKAVGLIRRAVEGGTWRIEAGAGMNRRSE